MKKVYQGNNAEKKLSKHKSKSSSDPKSEDSIVATPSIEYEPRNEGNKCKLKQNKLKIMFFFQL